MNLESIVSMMGGESAIFKMLGKRMIQDEIKSIVISVDKDGKIVMDRLNYDIMKEMVDIINDCAGVRDFLLEKRNK